VEHPSLKTLATEGPLEQVVERAQQGDKEALSSLVDRFQNRLYRFCFYLNRDPKSAEDLSQETFVRVFTNLKKLKDPRKFESWLFQIAKNLFWDHLRSSRTTDVLMDDMLQTSDSPDLHIQIRRALSKLEPQDRLVLLLVDLQGYSYAEAAESLEISVEALTSRIYRARQAFLEAYDQDERKEGAGSSTEWKESG
jgi:RNA polymerase sigma-70 factor, ECF subfamily